MYATVLKEKLLWGTLFQVHFSGSWAFLEKWALRIDVLPPLILAGHVSFKDLWTWLSAKYFEIGYKTHTI